MILSIHKGCNQSSANAIPHPTPKEILIISLIIRLRKEYSKPIQAGLITPRTIRKTSNDEKLLKGFNNRVINSVINAELYVHVHPRQINQLPT